MASKRSWRTEFERCTEDALQQGVISADIVERCLSLSLYCDATDERQVDYAFTQLLHLAGRLWEEQGRESGQRPIIAAMNIALSAYAATGDPQAVCVLAKRLTRHGVSFLSLALYDKAVATDVPPRAGMRPLAIAKLQNNRGNLLRELGELDQAEVALTACLDAIDRTSDDEQNLLSVALNNPALVYFRRKDHARARDTLVEALGAMERASADPAETAITLDNLAQAEIGLARQTGPLWLSGDFVNANAAAHFRTAEHYLERAQQLLAEQLPQSGEDYVISLINSADLAAEWRDDAKRGEYGRRALEIVERGNISRETSILVMSLNGQLLLDAGQPDQALALLRPVFEDVGSTMPSHELPSRFLTTLLRSATLVGERALTERVGRLLAEVDDDMLGRLLAGAAESEAQRLFHPYGDRAELIVGHCLFLAPGGLAPSWVYDVVLNRKGVLSERQGLAWLRARVGSGRSAELLEQVRLLRAEVSRIDLDGTRAGAIQSARRSYADAVHRLAQAEARLNRELGPAQSAPPRISSADVQASLDPDTVLLDLVISQGPGGHRHYTMFLVRSGGPVEFRDLGRLENVNERIRALQDVLAAAPADDADHEDRAAALRRAMPELFLPEDVLAPHIVVAPTGMWGLIPMCLLPDAEDVPLIEHHVVDVVPSARWLLKGARGSEDTGVPQVFGDPDFDLGFPQESPFLLSIGLPRLPHTGDEVRAIAASLAIEPIIGENVTRERLLALSRPRILHLATHGVFLDAIGSLAEQSEPRASVMRMVSGTAVVEDQDISGWVTVDAPAAESTASLYQQRVEWLQTIGPSGQLSRSALLLAGFNRWLAGLSTTPEVGTGMVSAGEFALLDLMGTELVVLSACETGVGAVNYADGTLVGLRTAALAAGAACCVSSLWKVDDEQTSALMSAFYRSLADGHSSGAALRTAQLEIRERGADPYFWAGWVAEGAITGPR